MKKIYPIILSLFSISMLHAQTGNVGIGTAAPDASSALDITDANRGLLIPRVALQASNTAGPIPSPAQYLLVYNTATAGTAPNNVIPGYYFNSGTSGAPIWTRVTTNLTGWQTLGNTGTTATAYNDNGAQTNNFLGTTDNQPLEIYTNSSATTAKTDIKLYTSTSTGAVLTAPSDILHIRRNGTSGVNYAQVASFALGKYNNTINSETELGIRLANGSTSTPDVTVMTLRGNGNVGIGITAPSAQLHTTGTVRLANYPSGLLAADATGLFTTPRTITGTSNQIVSTNGTGVSGNPTLKMDDAYAASVKAGYALTGGGNITYTGGYLSWSSRFIVINNGYGSQFSSNGYFDMSLPGSGVTITGVGGTGNVTTTANGVPIGAWQALYYILPIGSSNTSLNANYRLVQYNSAFVVPENWVLIASQNNDDGTLKIGNGVIIKPGTTWASGSGTVGSNSTSNTNWVMSSNMAYSPDDLTALGALSNDLDDDVTYQFQLPFNFIIDGTTYTYLAICTNGWASFETVINQITQTTFTATALPNSNFSNPTIFPYHADLKDYGSGEILRAFTVGTSPNRTVVINWQMRLVQGTVYKAYFQCQIHETSNLINVRYQILDASMNGQANNSTYSTSAAIGFQMAGGSSAKAFPITYNGKVLDDNMTNIGGGAGGSDEGWSVCPLR